MIAVTIALGKKYERLSRAAVASCSEMTGLTPVVLTERDAKAVPPLKRPHHLKFFIPECLAARGLASNSSVMYFDADVLFLQKIDPTMLARDVETLGVVADEVNEGSTEDAKRSGIPQAEYFNSGFMFLNTARHDPMLKAAYLLTHYYQGNVFRGDQSFLNIARHKLRVPTHWLPREWNFVNYHKTDGQPGAIVAHLNGLAVQSELVIDQTIERILGNVR